MGLDIYIHKKITISHMYDNRDVEGKIEIKRDGVPLDIDIKKVKYICEEIGGFSGSRCWFIRDWFIKNLSYYKDYEFMDVRIYNVKNGQKTNIAIAYTKAAFHIGYWLRNRLCNKNHLYAKKTKGRLFNSKLLDDLEEACWSALSNRNYDEKIWGVDPWFIDDDRAFERYYEISLSLIFEIKRLRKEYGNRWKNANFMFESD